MLERLSQSEPVFYEGNPSCESLGIGSFSYKVEPVESGTYALDGTQTVTLVVDGVLFDWSASMTMDAVIVKGGPNANVYFYEPEAASNQGEPSLHAPVNPSNGVYYGLSHVELCFDYEVAVEKTAVPSFDRTYSWTLEKAAATDALLLSEGQVFLLDYTVDLAETFADSNFAVSGVVTVTNPAPVAATVTGIVDLLAGSPVTLVCPVSFPVELAPTASLACSYEVAVPDATARTNVVEVTTVGAVGGGAASAVADFAAGAVIARIDECVDVADDLFGPLGTVCAPGPHRFAYTMALGPLECGEADVTNVASFVAADTGATGSDSWTVHVSVPCPEGCTLTPGYWKTHSELGPAPYDDTWALLPMGAATPFYLSGASYHDVLWTPPAGNVYFTLARAFIAAELNRHDGADFDDAEAAYAEAAALFAAHTPAQVGAMRARDVVRARMVALAGTLDAYNNGLTGPGHCDE
jgi:hypothetical protein